jgi:ribosomal protein L12E/L44/L45/RPP1/RPP2
MDNPLVKQDLVAAIIALREDVERQLKANKYYIALQKLDELLAAIKPLEIIEATAEPAPARAIAAASPAEAPRAEAPQASEARAEAPSEYAAEEVKVFHGVVREQVGDPSWAPHEATPS